MMEQYRHSQVEDRLYRLAYSSEPGVAADALQDEAEEMLKTGYPRDVLYEDFENVALDLRRDGHEDLEDDVLEVMDVLVGRCAPSARI